MSQSLPPIAALMEKSDEGSFAAVQFPPCHPCTQNASLGMGKRGGGFYQADHYHHTDTTGPLPPSPTKGFAVGCLGVPVPCLPPLASHIQLAFPSQNFCTPAGFGNAHGRMMPLCMCPHPCARACAMRARVTLLFPATRTIAGVS